MADPFSAYQASIDGPASRAFAITPHDSTLFTNVTRGIYVGVTGNITALLVGDTVAVLFTAVPAGTVLPIRAQRVNSTATTASAMVGLY